MKNIQKKVEVKEGKSWRENYIDTNERDIYESLAMDLINKKIHNAAYIKSIKRVPNYDGTQNITVTYNNDCRAIYTVKSH